MGSAEHVQVQLALPLGRNIEPGVNEEATQVRISDDLLLDRVAPFRVGVGDLHAESRVSHAVHRRSHVAALVVEEGLAIADQILQVTDLRGVDGGVIAFGDHAVGDRVPDPTGSGVGGADRLLGASRPARFNARSTGRWVLSDHNGSLWLPPGPRQRKSPNPKVYRELTLPASV